MLIYHHNSTSEIVSTNSAFIAVLHHFGIKPSYGEDTVLESAKRGGANLYTLLEVLNLYHDNNYFPSRIDSTITISSIVDYINRATEYILDFQISNISRHITPLISSEKMQRIATLFTRLKEQIQVQYEEQKSQQFPAYIELENNFRSISSNVTFLIGAGGESDDNRYEAMVGDIKKVMIKHMGGEININMFHAVVYSLSNLEKELQKLRLVKERLLFPLVEAIQSASSEHTQLVSKDSNTLSDREIEVLKLIASGKLNKEIAAELNISINTVLSHRKNITSRLGIKSVPALTFYALANGIVSSENMV